MIRSIARHALVAGVVGAIALSACGSDDDNAGTTAVPAAGADATDAAPPDTGAAPAATDAAPAATQPAGKGDYPAPAATDAGTTPAPAAGDGTELTIKDFTFSDITATAGTEFTIANQDGFKHTVTDRDGSFDVGVDGGTTETLTIDRAGTYEIFCRIHSQMSGTITVT